MPNDNVEVTGLELKIVSDSQGAKESLIALRDVLKSYGNTKEAIENLKAFSGAVETLNSSVKGLSDIKLDGGFTESISKTFSALANIDSETIKQKLGVINDGMNQLMNTARELKSELGGVDLKEFIDFAKAQDVVSEKPPLVGGEIFESFKAFEDAKKSLMDMQKARVGFSDDEYKSVLATFKELEAETHKLKGIEPVDVGKIKSAKQAINDLANAEKELSSISNIERVLDPEKFKEAELKVADLREEIEKLTSEMNSKELSQLKLPKLEAEGGESKSMLSLFSLFKDFSAGGAEGALTGVIGTLGEAIPYVGIAIGVFKGLEITLKPVIEGFKKLGEVIKNAGMKILEVAKNIGSQLSPAVKSILNPFKGLTDEIKAGINLFSKFEKKIISTAFTKSIRQGIKLFAEGIKTGVDNLYQASKYTDSISDTFASSMDKIATSMLYLKNSVGAMVAPLINYFAPVIDMCVDKVVNFLNSINMLLARLTGASYWTKALKYSTDYADNMDKATGATKASNKALKDFTISLDELNILNDKGGTGGGTGGGASADALDYSKMFEEVKLDNSVKTWVDNLREAFENADFKGAGEILGNKLNDMIDRIPAERLGSVFASKINDVISLGLGFDEAINPAKWGVQLSGFLYNLIYDIHWGDLGALMGSKWGNVFEFANGFIQDFLDRGGFKLLGSSAREFITEYFNHLNLKDLAQAVSGGITGILQAGITLFGTEKKGDKNSIRVALSTQLANFFNNLDIGKILENAIVFLGTTSTWVLGLINDTIEKTDWKKVKTSIKDGLINGIKGIDKEGLTREFYKLFKTIVKNALESAFKFAVGALNLQNIIMYEAGNASRNSSGEGKQVHEEGANMARWAQNAILATTAFDEMAEGGARAVAYLESHFGLGAPINLGITKMTDNLKISKNAMTSLADSFKSGTSSMASNMNKLGNDIKTPANKIISASKGVADSVTDAFNQLGKSMKAVNVDVSTKGNKAGKLFSNLSFTSIPKVGFKFLAKGGVVTAPIVGEAGKEAVLPLDQNTKWLDMISERVMDSTAMQVDAITSAIERASGGDIVLTLDGEVIYRNQKKIAMRKGYDTGMGVYGL